MIEKIKPGKDSIATVRFTCDRCGKVWTPRRRSGCAPVGIPRFCVGKGCRTKDWNSGRGKGLWAASVVVGKETFSLQGSYVDVMNQVEGFFRASPESGPVTVNVCPPKEEKSA